MVRRLTYEHKKLIADDVQEEYMDYMSNHDIKNKTPLKKNKDYAAKYNISPQQFMRLCKEFIPEDIRKDRRYRVQRQTGLEHRDQYIKLVEQNQIKGNKAEDIVATSYTAQGWTVVRMEKSRKELFTKKELLVMYNDSYEDLKLKQLKRYSQIKDKCFIHEKVLNEPDILQLKQGQQLVDGIKELQEEMDGQFKFLDFICERNNIILFLEVKSCIDEGKWTKERATIEALKSKFGYDAKIIHHPL